MGQPTKKKVDNTNECATWQWANERQKNKVHLLPQTSQSETLDQ
jgi:hypothetical protein